MHLNSTVLRISLALVLSIPALSQADTKLVYNDTGFGPQARTTTIQVQGHKVRMEDSTSGIYTLYDGDTKTLNTVNTKTKQYLVTNAENLKARLEKAVAMHKQFKEEMQKQIAQLPEADRKAAEERLAKIEEARKAPAPAVKMTKTERKEKVQNIECVVSNIALNDKGVRDVCIADVSNVNADDHQALVAMYEFMDMLSAESAKAQEMAAPSDGAASLHKQGLVAFIQNVPEGPRSELSSISKDALKAEDFTIPADYALFDPLKAAEEAAKAQAAAPAPAATPAPAAAPAPAM